MSDATTVLMLRTCNADLTSHNGFKWPAKGPVSCPDWNPKPVCGSGLHGLPWGKGDWTLLGSSTDAIWQVVEVEDSSAVDIDGDKSKFPAGNVVFSGPMAQAVTMVLCHPDAMKHSDIASSGHSSTAASSGHYSTAASSGHSSAAASSGDYSAAASSGHYSTAASSGHYSTAASSGDSSAAASSGHSSTAEAKGKDTIAMAAGIGCAVSAGENGCFAAAWYDEASKRNRIQVAYVGEDDIDADTLYRIDSAGKWVAA